MTDKDFDKPHTPAEVIEEHRDPITGAPHSHPTATGVGAAALGVITTAAGALAAGPLGAIAGAIVGSSAGGLVGHTVGEQNERKELDQAESPDHHRRLVEEDRLRNATDTTHLEPGGPARSGDLHTDPLAAPLPSATRDVPNSADFTPPQTRPTDPLGSSGARASVDSPRQHHDSPLNSTGHFPQNSLGESKTDSGLDANHYKSQPEHNSENDLVGIVVVEETTIIARAHPTREG